MSSQTSRRCGPRVLSVVFTCLLSSCIGQGDSAPGPTHNAPGSSSPLAALPAGDAIDSGGGANLHVFAPKNGDRAGVGSRAFLLDLVARIDGDLAATGATPELSGPGAHANTAPLPGSTGAGHNPEFPRLVALLSARGPAATFGPGKNLANLFNIVAVTNRENDRTEIWSTWIIGGPNVFGTQGEDTDTTVFIAVVDGTAPDDVTDENDDGKFDEKDLEAMGVRVLSKYKADFTVVGD